MSQFPSFPNDQHISVPSISDDSLQDLDRLGRFSHLRRILDLFHMVDNGLLGTPNQYPRRQDSKGSSYNNSDDPSGKGKLQQILLELAACKARGGENVLKTAISMLNKLSSCLLAEKVVLVIAAFALDHGDFSGLKQLADSLDHLAKSSVGITNQKVIEVSKLAEDTSKVISNIIELEDLSSEMAEVFYKNTLATETLAKCIPVHVFWAIITFVACTTQMYCLSSEEDKTLELSPFSEKMNSTRNKQKTQMEEFDQHTEKVNEFWERTRRGEPETPRKIVEAFKALDGSCITDGSTKKLLGIDVLKNKNVLLFISDGIKDISHQDLSILETIFYAIRDRDEPYKIVWMPIVEHWTDDLQITKFDMPWYILQGFPATVDMKNEYCSLENKPIVVVINPQGEVEHPNALSMIRLCGMKAFPFTAEVEKWKIPEGLNVQSKTYASSSKTLTDVMNYTFYCDASSGRREEFTTELKKLREYFNNKLAEKAVGNWKIQITKELFGVGNSDQSFISNYFKSDMSGWVVLCKGTQKVVSDSGETILNVLKNSARWKEDVGEFGFDTSFQNYYNEIRN